MIENDKLERWLYKDAYSGKVSWNKAMFEANNLQIPTATPPKSIPISNYAGTLPEGFNLANWLTKDHTIHISDKKRYWNYPKILDDLEIKFGKPFSKAAVKKLPTIDYVMSREMVSYDAGMLLDILITMDTSTEANLALIHAAYDRLGNPTDEALELFPGLKPVVSMPHTPVYQGTKPSDTPIKTLLQYLPTVYDTVKRNYNFERNIKTDI